MTGTRICCACLLLTVPVTTVLADGPAPFDRKLIESVRLTLAHGAAVYNAGDHAGCCRVFEGALTSLKPLLDHRPQLQKEIDQISNKASLETDAATRAFTLRSALTGVWFGLDPSIKEKIAAEKRAAPELELTAEEREVVELTNRERSAHGLPPLRPDPRLFAAARVYSAVMARVDRLGHAVDGSQLGGRVRAAGYGWSSCAENVAAGQATPAEAVGSWLRSSGHRANLLGAHSEIGIGIAISPSGTRYWAQVFASP